MIASLSNDERQRNEEAFSLESSKGNDTVQSQLDIQNDAPELQLRPLHWKSRFAPKPTLLTLSKFNSRGSIGQADSPSLSTNFTYTDSLERTSPREYYGIDDEPESALHKCKTKSYPTSNTEAKDIRVHETSTDSEQKTFNDELYLRAESFLDSENLRIVIPGDEHKQKKFVRVLTKTNSLNGPPQSEFYSSSPLLSEVATSSLLARRQNSPLLKMGDQGSPLKLAPQKSFSLPLNPSRFSLIKACNEEEPDTPALAKEEEKQGEIVTESILAEGKAMLQIQKPSRPTNIQTKLGKLNIFASGKITEENSPFTPYTRKP